MDLTNPLHLAAKKYRQIMKIDDIYFSPKTY